MNAAASSASSPSGGADSPDVLANLSALIRLRAGIVISDQQTDTLRKALAEAVGHFGDATAAGFVERLRKLPSTTPEMEYLMARVTIGESYFFRDSDQMDFLRETWLPRVTGEKRKADTRTLRIWCAGCSNGQEPYSIAMMLQDGMPDLAHWDIDIQATDVNTEALQTAAAARYTSWSFRVTPDDVRNRFFFRDGKHFVLNERTRSLVNFSYLNLIDDAFPSLGNHTANLDLILCRNVFIYFDRPTVAGVMRKFAACLVPGGHAMVGAADPVAPDVAGLIYHHTATCGYFRRPATGEDLPRAETPKAIPPLPRPLPSRMPRPVTHAVPRATVPASPPSSVPADSDLKVLIKQGDWAAAYAEATRLEAAGKRGAPIRRAKAKALANLGRLAEARDECLELTADANTDKHNYFLLGLIELDQGNGAAAEQAFRRALFLDRTFAEAHHQLALTLIRAGNLAAGLKSLRNALAQAEAAPVDRAVHEAPDMTMGRLADVLRQTVALYEEA